MSSNTPYIILLVLTVIVLGIYLYQNRMETFDPSITMPLVNLADGDLHLTSDNNPELIKTTVFNYPLHTISKVDNSISKIYISVFMHSQFKYNTRNNHKFSKRQVTRD
jgi:hypothetical protein